MSARLHKKYGRNSTMTQCFFCGETKEILLVGSATKKFKEAGLASQDGEMNYTIGVVDREPCPTCKGYMEQGIVFISIKDGEAGSKDPYRTGKLVVVRERIVEGLFTEEGQQQVLQHHYAFVEDTMWDLLGLSRTPPTG